MGTKNSWNKILTRIIVPIFLMIVFGVGTAFLGWMSFAGIGVDMAIFFLSPLIAFTAPRTAPRREFYVSFSYVALSLVIYWIGLDQWGYIKSDWLTYLLSSNDLQLIAIGLACCAFTTLPVYLSRKYPF